RARTRDLRRRCHRDGFWKRRVARPERLAQLRAVPRDRGAAHRGPSRPSLPRSAAVTGRHEPGPRSREIVAREQRHIAPGLQSFALHAGLAMARGEGCTLVDEDGRSYIDFIAGIGVGSVGHCHPHYVSALQRQAEQLTFGSFTTETRARFLELLASVTP